MANYNAWFKISFSKILLMAMYPSLQPRSNINIMCLTAAEE